MITRFLATLTDFIILMMVYCFAFVAVIIVFFDRDTNWDQYMNAFYVLLIVSYYCYFLIPIMVKQKTLGKLLFKISIVHQKKPMELLRIHLKYCVVRFIPFITVMLFFETNNILLKIMYGLISLYPLIDLLFIKYRELSLTDQLLKIETKVY